VKLKSTFAIVLISLFLPNFGFTKKDEVWVQKASFGASGRHGAVGFSIGNKGYIGLGQINSGPGIADFHDIWEFDPASNSWTQKADYPGVFTAYASALGYESKAFIINDQCFKFDPIANTFTDLGLTPTSLGYAPLAQIDSMAYFFNLSNEVATFDMKNQVWDNFSTNSSLFTYDSFNFNERIICMGKVPGEDFAMHELNFEDSSFSLISYFPDTVNLAHLVGSELNGFAYFALGSSDSFGVGNVCWKYDFGTGLWTRLDDFPGTGRRYFAHFQIGERFYFGAGTNGTNHNDLWEFIPKDTVTIAPPEPLVIKIINLSPYPNPSQDEMTFELAHNTGDIHELKIFDLNGEIVGIIQSETNKLIISKSILSSGKYWYQLSKNEIQIKSGSLIFI
jgi:N-acetylneuraminic acid mutarotase